MIAPDTSITWFRDASPYIEAHHGRTLVLALPGELLRSDVLPTLTQDLTLLVRLGLRIVLCFGLRAQLDERLDSDSPGARIVDGRRVTDDAALEALVTAAGRARTDLEARLSRGLPNTPMAGSPLSVSSGNLVAARPFGIHDGVDFRHTGTVREVRVGALRTLLDAGHLVLLPPLGHSLTGDVFNLPADEVAERVAVELGADKLVYLVETLPRDAEGRVIRQASAERLALDAVVPADGQTPSERLGHVLERACRAARAGVARVHLLEGGDPDALLRELFSRDGSGTMVTATRWDHVRDAVIGDVGGIIELIAPLQESGALVARSREQLELDIERFVVTERDGAIIACAALHLHGHDASPAGDAPHEHDASPMGDASHGHEAPGLEDVGTPAGRTSGASSAAVEAEHPAPTAGGCTAEIACVATHPGYRGQGHADALLALLESRAREAGAARVLLLSTRAGHWFVERGYVETTPEALPSARRALYNRRRNSKVYAKALHVAAAGWA